MKAITFNHTGEPHEVLTLTEQKLPSVLENQVLIKVKHVTIQPADFLFISGKYRIKPAFPQVSGVEGYGEVIEVGNNAKNRIIGDRVAFRTTGAWAEYAVAMEDRTYIAPVNVDTTMAAQFSLNPLTAWGLLDVSIKKSESNILYTAANSVVARQSAYIAVKKEHNPYGLIRIDNGYLLTDLKCNQVLSKASSISECLEKADISFDVIIDAIGGKDTPVLIQSIKQNGVFVSFGILDNSCFTLPTSTILFKNLVWLGFGIDKWLSNLSQEKLTNIVEKLWCYLQLNPELTSTSKIYDASDFRAALCNAVSNKSGKTLISFS
jgi:NADPH:quinone reductase-like Zn-dependent oxidoreductase